MIRYYKTVAEMFYAEKKFKDTLLGTNGFCLGHFGQLLRYASYARGKRRTTYIRSPNWKKKTSKSC